MPWIAKCLNLHPSMRALLNARGSLNALAKAELTAPQYLEAIGRLSEGYDVCGDVHGVSPHEFGELSTVFGEAFRGAHAVGPPVLRLAGSLAYSRSVSRRFSHQAFLDLWGLTRDHPLSRALLTLLGEEGDHVPAHYMMHVNGLPLLVGTAPTFRIDRLMTEDTEWATLTAHLSGGAVTDFGDAWRRLEGGADRGRARAVSHARGRRAGRRSAGVESRVESVRCDGSGRVFLDADC